MTSLMTQQEYYMALDVGTKRIGVAVAHVVARLPRPLLTLRASEQSVDDIAALAEKEGVRELVVGLPRSMDGSSSDQTRYTEAFADVLKARLNMPVHLVDETLSSVQAEAGLRGRKYEKGDVDALAACIILERFLETDSGAKHE